MEWNNCREKTDNTERRLDDRGQVARKRVSETGIKDWRSATIVLRLMPDNVGKN